MKKFEKLDADTAERAKKAAEEITRRSKETYKKIKGYLDQAHERYAKKGTLTMDDMRKFNRLKNLENAIAEAMEENRILTDKEIEKLLSESAKSALYVCTNSGGGGRKEKSIRAIKKDIDVAEILDETVAGRNWKERTKHLSANAAYDIITEVRKGIDQGDSFHDMAKAIKKKMGEYNGRPITIAKTETHRVIETTKFKAMESVSKQVPQLKVWRTVSDERVRDSHKAMEGQTVKLDEEFTLPSGAKTMYPGQSGIAAEDINCRCFVEYIDAPKETEDYDVEIAETLDFSEEKGYNINIEIDKFTDCLVDKTTNKEVETVVEPIKPEQTEPQKWTFDWPKMSRQCSDIRALKVKGSDEIQGMIAMEHQKDGSVFVKLVESAKHNRGKNKKYEGVGAHLFAIACKDAKDNGSDYIYFDSKTKLIDYYAKELGARLVGIGDRMFISGEAFDELIEKYFKE